MSKQSAYTGALNIGNVKIPISIYGTVDLFGIEGHLYHEDCNGKIRESRYCEVHPNLPGPVSFSGIDIGGEIVKVDSELRNTLLDRKAPFVVRSAHKLATLGNLMSDGLVMPLFMFEVAPQAPTDPKMSLHHNALITLFNCMEKKKVFLLCSVGLAGINRRAILLPGGLLYVLTYQEELREFIEYDGEIDKALSKFIDEFLTTKSSTTVPTISLSVYRKRVAAWFQEILTPIAPVKKPKSNPKKQHQSQKVGS